LKVAACQEQWLQENEEKLTCYFDIDQYAVWSILDMPPVKVDVDRWLAAVKMFDLEATEIEDKLGFNSKSPEQVREALRKLSGKGTRIQDTRHETLVALLEDAKAKGMKKFAALIETILKARLYRDAVSKYGRTWIEENVEEGGLVYAAWKVTGAETGRMACSSPNLMNIPVRQLPIYRTFFVPSAPGNMLLKADIVQQEPRFTAYFSRDKELIKAIKSGEDIHDTVANAVGSDRFTGKTINLGTSYGLSSYGLAKRIGISEDAAQAFIDKYFQRFRGVKDYIDAQRRDGFRLGYVRTTTGRRVWINEYNYQWRNNVINAPIQGSSAELMKMWVNMVRARAPEWLGILVVHDELVCDVPKGMLKDYRKVLKDALDETADVLAPGIPFEIEMKAAKTWLASEEE
jgi:DNA polymerase-1